MTTRNVRCVLGAAIFIAVAIRLVLGIVHPFWFPDSADYDALAKAIVHGMPYEVNGLYATRMPGYPVFVAAVYALFGPSVKAVVVIQAFMGGAITWLTFLIGGRISVGLGLLAAVLVAVDPLSIGFSAAFLSETPFTLLLLLAVWLFLKLSGGGRFWMWAIVGVIWGMAVYMRASALWLIVPLAMWIAFSDRIKSSDRAPRRLEWRGPLLSITLVLLSLLPWQWRNYQLFHEHMFRLTTLEGISLYEAVYPGADGSPKQDVIPLPENMVRMNEAERNDEWSRGAWGYIYSDPLRIAELAVRKIGRTWSPWMNAAEFRNEWVQAGMMVWQVPLFIFGIAGLLGGAIPFRMKGLLAIPLLYFTAVHALFLGSVRYRVPLMPLVCIFAAAGVSGMMKRMRKSKPGALVMV